MRRKRSAALWILVLLLVAGPGVGRADEGQELRWSLSGEARFRPEWRDDADLDGGTDDDTRQGFMRLRIGAQAIVRRDYRVFLQVQDSRLAGEETSTASNQKNLDLHQGYLEMTTGERKSLSLAVGRQEWTYGDHRLVGNFVWDNVGRAFDGLRIRFSRERFFLDGLLARVTSRSAANSTTGSSLYGIYAQVAPRTGAEYEAYWLGFDDQVAATGETGVSGTTGIDALGVRARDRLGRFDYVAEAVVERGEFLGDELSARAAASQVGVTWGRGVKVRMFAGYDFATGDEDPMDGERQEFFNFFPTNHPHYGYMDYEGWRNLKSPHGGVAVTAGRHHAQLKVHRFGLQEERGPWKDAGGIVLGFDPTGVSGRSVGREIDLTYRFTRGEKTSLEGGLSRFAPGRFARLVRGEDPSHWAYLMLTLGF